MTSGISDWNRIVSGVIAISWLALSAVGGGAVAVLYAALSLLVPLACIWFPDALGGLTTTLPGLSTIPITRESPGCAVRFLGWVALLSLTVLRAIIVVALAP